MAASGILATAVNSVTAVLTTLGVPWTTDPRNIRPKCVLVQVPSFDAFTYNVGDIQLTLNICAAPPANTDASDYLVTTADQIMNSALSVTDGRPGRLDVSGQELPTYDLTVAVAVKRN